METITSFLGNLTAQEITFALFGGWAIFAILTGKLVTRSIYDEAKKEAESWKEAYKQEQLSRRSLQESTELAIQHSRTTNKLLQALPQTPPEEEN